MEQSFVPANVNLAEALSTFSETWTPRIIGDINESQAKLAKLEGELIWHHHDREDEMFLVPDGTLNTGNAESDRTRENLERLA